jgi:hypothetical protein
MTTTDATKRLCPNGHLLDPAWEVCPYCPSDRRGTPDLARTVRLEDVARPPDIATAEARRTELLDRPLPVEGLGWFVADAGERRGQMHRIDRERMSVGAAGDCDIVLDDPHVSDHHASIRLRGRAFVVTDLDSTNGTFVNGQTVGQHTLADGDRVRFGPSEWVFKCVVFQAP